MVSFILVMTAFGVSKSTSRSTMNSFDTFRSSSYRPWCAKKRSCLSLIVTIEIVRLLMNSFLAQISFGIQSSHAAGAGGSNRLPVNFILHITAREHSFNICSGCSRNCFYIPRVIHIQPAFENVRVWLMSNGNEKSTDRNALLFPCLIVEHSH